jgi:hypothetical protein
MLSKTISNNLTKPSQFVAFVSRGVYAPGTEPHVFINKHTRVIVQGMTGKHVSYKIEKE